MPFAGTITDDHWLERDMAAPEIQMVSPTQFAIYEGSRIVSEHTSYAAAIEALAASRRKISTYVRIPDANGMPYIAGDVIHKADLSDLGEPYLSAVRESRAAMARIIPDELPDTPFARLARAESRKAAIDRLDALTELAPPEPGVSINRAPQAFWRNSAEQPKPKIFDLPPHSRLAEYFRKQRAIF